MTYYNKIRQIGCANILAHPCFMWVYMDISALIKGKTKEKTIFLPINCLTANPYQPRKHFDEEELCALADSIKNYGLIQPIAVKPIENGIFISEGIKYEIIAGERRWRAAKLAGLTEIKCTVFDADRTHSAMMALIENLQRNDLSYFEEAMAMQTLLRLTEMTQGQLARALSISQSTLSNKLRLLRLSERERLIAIERGFSERHCRALVRIEKEDERRELIREIIEKNLQAPDTEKLIERHLSVSAEEKELPKAEPSSKPKPLIKGNLKDIRLLFNTVDRAVQLLHSSGYRASWQKEERDGFLEVKICITPSKKAGD